MKQLRIFGLAAAVLTVGCSSGLPNKLDERGSSTKTSAFGILSATSPHPWRIIHFADVAMQYTEASGTELVFTVEHYGVQESARQLVEFYFAPVTDRSGSDWKKSTFELFRCGDPMGVDEPNVGSLRTSRLLDPKKSPIDCTIVVTDHNPPTIKPD